MSDDKFRELVRNMRIAQQLYFKTRSQAAMDMAKHYEIMVDKYLNSIYEPTLF